MKRTFQRCASFAAAVLITVSSVLSVYAEEIPFQEETQEAQAQVETEAAKYEVTLPWYEGCTYLYDTDRQKEDAKEQDQKDLVLLYEAEETVELSIQPTTDLLIGEVQILDNEKQTIPFAWTQEGSMEFTMPEKDIRLNVSFVTPETPAQTEPPVQSETPEQSETPVQSETPEQSETPAQSETPEQSEPPAQSETPEQSETPAQSETPEQSEPPVQSEAPGQSEPPVQPETPEQSEAPEQTLPIPQESEPMTETQTQESVLPETNQTETDNDGLPAQGSIVMTNPILIPFDTWDFDQYNDFRNIPFTGEQFEIEYISDDIIYDVAGVYSCIYRVTDTASGKFWYVLRPVEVAESGVDVALPGETQTEAQSETEIFADEPYNILDGIMTAAEAPGKFKLVVGGVYSAPSSLNNFGASTSYKEVQWLDGGETISQVAYCIEPRKNAPGSGHVYKENEATELKDGNAMAKGMYYLYGGPAWGKDATYTNEAGKEKTVNLKKILTDAGCTTASNYYTLTHYILSYIYLNGGDWNCNNTYNNVLNSKGVALVKEVVDYLKMIEKPTTRLSVTELTAEALEAGTDRVSGSTTYKAPEENTAKIEVPAGITLVNDTTGESTTGEKVAKINGGDKFHFVVANSFKEKKVDFTLTCRYAVDFSAYKLEISNYQDIGFSFYSGDKTLKLTLIIDEDPTAYYAQVQKVDAATQTAQPVNGNYSLAGAVYTLYADAGCTTPVTTLTTGADGKSAAVEVKPGTYYAKETKASPGYQLDPTVYPVTTVANQTASFTSKEQPIKKPIEIQKYDKETGKPQPYNGNVSFAGAQYTVYSDSTLKNPVEVLTTNASGYAKSSDLYFGTYYVKETKAPQGYLLDSTVHTVTVANNAQASYKVNSNEQVIKKPIELQKLDKETGLAKPFNEHVSFTGAQYTIYSDSALKNPVEVLTTNDKGYAKSKNLYPGTYYVKETKAPQGYLLDETVYPVTVKDDAQVSYKVNSNEQVIKKPIELQKFDKETGLTKPFNDNASFAGAQYTIYSDEKLTQAVEVLTTDENGYAKSKDLYPGYYYVKETKAPLGYLLDETVYPVSVMDDGKVSYKVNSHEQIIKKPVELQKIDRESGAETPNNSAVSFEGAEYTIYTDKGCTEALEVLTTDENGYAKSGDLYFGTYYICETKAPEGYLLDNTVYTAVVGVDPAPTVEVTVSEQVIRGSVSLMKYLDEDYDSSILQDWINKGELLGIRFTLTHEDPNVPVVTIETDKYGYATTGEKALVYGEWTLSEDPETTPEDYEGLTEAKIQIREDGVELKYVVTNLLKTTPVKILKKDQTTGDMIPRAGAQFQIIDEDGKPVEMRDNLDYGKITDTFTTNGEGVIYLTEPLRNGDYILKEVKAPEGYLLAEELPFTIDLEEKKDDTEPFIIECYDDPQLGRIRITKKNQEGNVLGAGFTFELRVAEDILDAQGNVRTMEIDGEEIGLTAGTVITELTTGADGTVMSPDLYLGSYIVQETVSGEHFAIDPTEHTVTLSYDSELVTVIADLQPTNQKTALDIYKVDSESSKEHEIPLEGIKFRIASADEIAQAGGSVETIDRETLTGLGIEYTTDKDGRIHIEDLKHDTVYYIIESGTLEGYNLSDEIWKVAVDENGLIDGQPSYLLKISNTANNVEITKRDITGEKELPGATLTITDAEGNVVDTWVSTDKPHRIKGLAAGTYTLTEERAPEGYAIAEAITFTLTDSMEVQQVIMYDAQIVVEISKQDITNQTELPGASLKVTDSKGNVVEEWISDNTPHKMNLATGKYTLTEIMAPAKYAKAESIEFEVTDSMEVQKVVMYDKLIEVEISKLDITNDKELPGAVLTVKDSAGNLVEQWTSTKEPHKMNLAKGKYTLTEVTAPDGYEVAESVNFEVTDSMEVQKVVMYDEPKEDTVDLTGKKKEETKTTPPQAQNNNQTTVTTPPVKTGDVFRFVPAILLIGAGCVLFVVYRKLGKKK